MSVEWKYKIKLLCSKDEDGTEIYEIIKDFVRLNNVIWDGDNKGHSMFVYADEAYDVPSEKTSKFVRFVCRWFAEAIVEYGQDEGEYLLVTTVTVRSDGGGLFRNTFELTVSWRDHEYTLRQYLIPRHGDEAFYNWDEDEEKKEGGAK